MIFGEHLSAHEEPPRGRSCKTCGAQATVEVFDDQEESCGCHCDRCGRALVEKLNVSNAPLALPTAITFTRKDRR